MNTHFLSVGLLFVSISPSLYGKEDNLDSIYAGGSVAYNATHTKKGEQSLCDGLNGIIDGLNLGYQFSPYLQVEVEYQYLGCMTTLTQLNRDMRQGVISSKFGYPISDKFTPYLKLGTSVFSGGGRSIGAVIGSGLSYRVSDYFVLNAEYQYTELLSNDVIGQFTHQRFSLGMQYRFGSVKPRVISIEKPVVQEVIVEKVVKQFIEVEKKPLETVVISSVNKETALFENNSSQVTNVKGLLPVVTHLKMNPKVKVLIVGYTDSIGSAKYNQWLSSIRAKNVGDYLIRQGISESRIVTEGKGELDPVASNSTIAGRAENRRVSIEFN
jgi:OOP family OmpA-OmpF porin